MLCLAPTVFFTVALISTVHHRRMLAPKLSADVYKVMVFAIISLCNFVLNFFLGYHKPINIVPRGMAPILCAMDNVALFLGPMVYNFYCAKNAFEKRQRDGAEGSSFLKFILRRIGHGFGLFTVIFAPFFEEFMYRYLCVNTLVNNGYSNVKSVLIPPIIFSLAHFHHYFEGVGLFSCLLQVSFTYLFGIFSGLLWIKTFNIFIVMFSHGFCNYMRFPDFYGMLTWKDPTERIIMYISLFSGVAIFTILTYNICVNL